MPAFGWHVLSLYVGIVYEDQLYNAFKAAKISKTVFAHNFSQLLVYY